MDKERKNELAKLGLGMVAAIIISVIGTKICGMTVGTSIIMGLLGFVLVILRGDVNDCIEKVNEINNKLDKSEEVLEEKID